MAGVGPNRVVGAVLVAGLVVVLAVGIVATLVREPTALDPSTPEGVVQGYLQAVFDEDWSTARDSLAPVTARRCSTVDFRRAWVPTSLTAVLDDVRTTADGAEVDVGLRQVQGPDPLGGGGYELSETFELIEVDGEWLITGWPWPVDDCRG
jgi:hypothetical protein